MVRKKNRSERRDVEKGETVRKENRSERTLKAAENWKVRRAFRNFESTLGFRDDVHSCAGLNAIALIKFNCI
jgi:hypothetical protein